MTLGECCGTQTPKMSQQEKSSLPSVLITGCSSGLGNALALRFAKAGYPTYATARRLESIKELAAAGCYSQELDVTDHASIRKVVRSIEQKHGSVGILVNNAAIGLMTPLETVPIPVVRQQYETNVFGLLAITQAVLPGMRKVKAGRVVNVGSSGGEFTTPSGGVYQATKYAVDSMSDAMRMELKGFGIDVVLIEPSAISSKFASNGAVLGVEKGPYAQLMRGVDKVTSAAIKEGAPGSWSPDDVARVVIKASTTPRPRARYRVGFVGRMLISLRNWLPLRIWDAMFISWLMREGKQA